MRTPTRCARGTGVLLALVAGSLEAQGARETWPLADAVAQARAANPGLRAARLRADAAHARTPAAGALPDPVVAFALSNRPLDGLGTDEPMTMNVFQLRQTLPWPGKLGFAEAQATHLAEAAELSALEVESALIAQVKGMYFDIARMDRSLAIMRETQELLREFLDVSNTLYSVGTGLQTDVLQAQVAIAGMSEDITVLERHRLAMAARLNALLGRDARVEVPWLELGDARQELPDLDELMRQAAESRPALRAAESAVAAAEAGARAARRGLFPDFQLSLEYGQRPQFADMLSFSLGLSIPIWAGRRQLPARHEALAMQAAQEAMQRDLLNETYALIAEAHADADRALRLSRLYATSILPQARAAVESALSAYRVGDVDFLTLVQNELTVNRYEIESVRLVAGYHTAIARLEALVGAPPEGTS